MKGTATSAQTLAGCTQHVHTYVLRRTRHHMCAYTGLEPSLSSTGSQMMWLLRKARIAGRMRSPPTSFLRPLPPPLLPCFLPGCSQAVPASKLNPNPQTIKKLFLKCAQPSEGLLLAPSFFGGGEVPVNVTASSPHIMDCCKTDQGTHRVQ